MGVWGLSSQVVGKGEGSLLVLRISLSPRACSELEAMLCFLPVETLRVYFVMSFLKLSVKEFQVVNRKVAIKS